MKPIPIQLCVAATLLAASPFAAASCGSAFCSLMTDRYAQGTGEPHIGWSADLRIESVSQSRLRKGTSNIDASQVTDEDAIERHTKNLNLVTTLSYGFDKDWSLSLRIPLVKRDHVHDLVDATTGAPSTREEWRFTKLGDVQLTARHQSLSEDVQTAWAWFGGVKLPTGSIDVVNADGSRAERALQPGSGTTDVVLGLALRHAVGITDALIGQASVTQALNQREAFRPGVRIEASIGWSHAFSEGIGSVLQLNLRRRGHDTGAQAEPQNSGSTTIDLSPGLTFAVGHSSTLYGYVQLPLYQNVNGIQLVPRSGVALGWTADF